MYPEVRLRGPAEVPRPAAARSTTSGARSSARPASSAPRPARSNASTWAASTRAVATTSTGARQRRTASGARNRRCGGPADRCPIRPTRRSSWSTWPPSTASSRRTTTTRPDLLAILEEIQAAYGYLPVAALKRISHETGTWYADDLRDRQLLRAPPLRAPDRDRPGRRRRRPSPAESTYLAALDAALGGACERGAPARRLGPEDVTDLLKTPAAWPRILLARADAKDPTDLDAAVKAGAFEALRRAIRELGRTAMTATIAASALRGRGGAGYPAGEKWRAAAATEAPRRYVVANGYGADPASHTDRTLLARDPYAVIEGVAIAAFAIGAEEAFIALRAEDTAAHRHGQRGHRVRHGGRLPGCRRPGLRPRRVRSRSGRSRAPTCWARRRSCSRPSRASAASPSSARRIRRRAGCSGMPTVVHNVQTLAFVPWIVREGADAFRATGTAHEPGTVLVQIRTPGGDEGIAEVPLGTPVARHHRAGRQAAGRPVHPGRSSSVGRRVGCCRQTCSTRRTPSSGCARRAPISAPARSSSSTTGPTSSSWSAC